jgi:hypothetical protein
MGAPLADTALSLIDNFEPAFLRAVNRGRPTSDSNAYDSRVPMRAEVARNVLAPTTGCVGDPFAARARS